MWKRFVDTEAGKRVAIAAGSTLASVVSGRSASTADPNGTTYPNLSYAEAREYLDVSEGDWPPIEDVTWSAADVRDLPDDDFYRKVRSCLDAYVEEADVPMVVTPLTDADVPRDFLIRTEGLSIYTRIRRRTDESIENGPHQLRQDVRQTAARLGVGPVVAFVYNDGSIDDSKRVEWFVKHGLVVFGERQIRREFSWAGLEPPASSNGDDEAHDANGIARSPAGDETHDA